ncbi:hypothetical protein XFF6990_80078 [Xanthomonas citri pv. fuscans]|nr:hypothetical protein XFF6990_80078 [Xanthomonas citri pv. fuscans]
MFASAVGGKTSFSAYVTGILSTSNGRSRQCARFGSASSSVADRPSTRSRCNRRATSLDALDPQRFAAVLIGIDCSRWTRTRLLPLRISGDGRSPCTRCVCRSHRDVAHARRRDPATQPYDELIRQSRAAGQRRLVCKVNLMLANPASMALHRPLEFARCAMPCWPMASMCSVWKNSCHQPKPGHIPP